MRDRIARHRRGLAVGVWGGRGPGAIPDGLLSRAPPRLTRVLPDATAHRRAAGAEPGSPRAGSGAALSVAAAQRAVGRELLPPAVGAGGARGGGGGGPPPAGRGGGARTWRATTTWARVRWSASRCATPRSSATTSWHCWGGRRPRCTTRRGIATWAGTPSRGRA